LINAINADSNKIKIIKLYFKNFIFKQYKLIFIYNEILKDFIIINKLINKILILL
jgi:hypothetical protein